MSQRQRRLRQEERKYKRIFVRYGHSEPRHDAAAQRITTKGFFLVTNGVVYTEGSPIVVEIRSPAQSWVVQGVVRHAVKVHPTLANYAKPGMGVELTDLPDACRTYLASL
ncbi:MAG TPA: hypothetical protein VN317_10525 [Candidatus Methanoperedens sp.]|nr:hypothetical protein [Candidatus Methanoperedens sp.]